MLQLWQYEAYQKRVLEEQEEFKQKEWNKQMTKGKREMKRKKERS